MSTIADSWKKECRLAGIDHFKAVNDTYGYAAGDMVLYKLGFLLKTNMRKGTVVARFGGEEFAVILPNAVDTTVKKFQAQIRSGRLSRNRSG